jgi:hypothetical protein
MQLLAEVLDHVIPLWFTVNEEIESNALLEAHDGLDFLLDEFLILRLSDFPLPKLGTSTADLLCLLEFRRVNELISNAYRLRGLQGMNQLSWWGTWAGQDASSALPFEWRMYAGVQVGQG